MGILKDMLGLGNDKKETRPENRTIKYVSETLESTPSTTKFVESGAAIGTKKTTVSGHVGKKAKLWKVIYENNVEVGREAVNKSNYAMSPETISVGTATDNAQAKALVQNAIKTQDEAKINAAIAEAQALIAATNVPVSEPIPTPETSVTEQGVGE